MPLKLPQIIGHRGCAGYAPENTLEGIYTAADMGVEWVELDIKVTKDQIPVLFHDETLERTTNGSGLIAETTYEDLKQLESGSWFSESFSGLKIPTLEEALEVIIECDLGLNLEIKPCPGREIETAEIALDILSHYWDNHEALLISSLSHVSLETAMDIATDWYRGLVLPKDTPENWLEFAKHLQVSTININAQSATQEQVQTIIELQKSPLIYTVNNPEQARIMQGWGARGFFSDEPDVIKDMLFTVH